MCSSTKTNKNKQKQTKTNKNKQKNKKSVMPPCILFNIKCRVSSPEYIKSCRETFFY